jgi:multidrug resistance efflux pump
MCYRLLLLLVVVVVVVVVVVLLYFWEGGTFYLNTQFAYVKFVGHIVKVSHRRHVCNC